MLIDFQQQETSIPLVREHLASLVDKKVFFHPLWGNRGDDLIVMGIEELLRRYKIRLVNKPSEADHVLIKGGGAFIDDYGQLLDEIESLLRKSVRIPTTILPTSYFLKERSVATMAGQREAPLRIYARERISFDLLDGLAFDGPCEIGLDHDTAFHLNDSEFLRRWRSKGKPKHVLIVERTDPESLPGTKVEEVMPAATKRLARQLPKVSRIMPRAVKHELIRRVELPKIEARALASPLAEIARERIYSDNPEVRNLPVRAFDVSQNRYFTFEQFAGTIADSAAVYTTRLHVGILSAMLDIPTYLVPGVYHKLRGIFAYSMAKADHVHLMEARKS